MKRYWFKITMIGYLSFILMGCNQATNPNVPNSAVPTPAPGDTTQMTPSLPTPADAGLQNLIAAAKEDLAQRLSIPITQIDLRDAVEVEWSDSSLDCPQPGMAYLQVITPGYQILLEAGGQVHEYHSNRNSYVIYCENPSPPIPGAYEDR